MDLKVNISQMSVKHLPKKKTVWSSSPYKIEDIEKNRLMRLYSHQMQHSKEKNKFLKGISRNLHYNRF